MPEDEISFGVPFYLFDYGIHEASSLCHLLGSCLVEVLASLRKFLIPSFNSLFPRHAYSFLLIWPDRAGFEYLLNLASSFLLLSHKLTQTH